MTIWCDSAIVLDACIQALADLDADVVVGAGNQELPSPLPANFMPLDHAPGQVLARRADAMVHHGGHGSTLTALAAGTPALIIPTYSERESNARRAAALGAATYLVPETEDGDAQHEPGLAMVPTMGGAGRQLDPTLVTGAVATLLFLPPKGKYFNPIELSFGTIKTHIRNSYAYSPAASARRPRTEGELRCALQTAMEKMDAATYNGYFKERADGRGFEKAFPEVWETIVT